VTNTTNQDPFDLNRFISAQDKVYDRVLLQLKNGRKRSHWMWYIFPQLDGLAQSTTSKYYAIKSPSEAITQCQPSADRLSKSSRFGKEIERVCEYDCCH
jgi:uncharacterized protein (DUF1810 family)